MPRHAQVLSDSESDDEGPGDKEPEEAVSEDEREGEGDDEEIVYESDVDPLDELEEELNKKEPPRRARKGKRKGKRKRKDCSSDEDDEYVPWRKRRAHYMKQRRLQNEPAGETEHPQVHAPGWVRNEVLDEEGEWDQARKDALWEGVKARATADGFYDKWGVQATERTVDGQELRIVHRTKYGWRFASWNKEAEMGTYLKAFVPVMEELFQQAPIQRPFQGLNRRGNPTKRKTWTYPEFLDFDVAYHVDKNVEWVVRGQNDEDDGPLWCLCTENSGKGLKHLWVMEHTLSGILVVTGGNCSQSMVNEQDVRMLHNAVHNEVHGDEVGQMLGV